MSLVRLGARKGAARALSRRLGGRCNVEGPALQPGIARLINVRRSENAQCCEPYQKLGPPPASLQVTHTVARVSDKALWMNRASWPLAKVGGTLHRSTRSGSCFHDRYNGRCADIPSFLSIRPTVTSPPILTERFLDQIPDQRPSPQRQPETVDPRALPVDHGVQTDHLTVIQYSRATGRELRGYRSELALAILRDPLEDRRPAHLQDLHDLIGSEPVLIHPDIDEPLLVGRRATLLSHARRPEVSHNATSKSRNW